MADPYLGEIRMFAGSFAPKDWALCDGRELPIVQHPKLFKLFEFYYGGDGKDHFRVPDLRVRVPVHVGGLTGQGPGLSKRTLGEKGGAETVTLTAQQIPNHNHPGSPLMNCVSDPGTTDDPDEAFWSMDLGVSTATYSSEAQDAQMSSEALVMSQEPVGGGKSHNNVQPSLAVTFIVALAGPEPEPGPA